MRVYWNKECLNKFNYPMITQLNRSDKKNWIECVCATMYTLVRLDINFGCLLSCCLLQCRVNRRQISWNPRWLNRRQRAWSPSMVGPTLDACGRALSAALPAIGMVVCGGLAARPSPRSDVTLRCRRFAWGSRGAAGEKPGFPHPGHQIWWMCFLALDFNGVGFLCVFLWVHSG